MSAFTKVGLWFISCARCETVHLKWIHVCIAVKLQMSRNIVLIIYRPVKYQASVLRFNARWNLRLIEFAVANSKSLNHHPVCFLHVNQCPSGLVRRKAQFLSYDALVLRKIHVFYSESFSWRRLPVLEIHHFMFMRNSIFEFLLSVAFFVVTSLQVIR
jgi:hypothetical protein